jgi:uncharacterized membrane protein YkoI
MTMKKRTKVALVSGAVAVAAAIGTGAAVSATGHDSEVPITGPDLAKASAAALAHTGGGRVSQTEVGDEDSYYEVEVTLDDGSQVDVQLNRDFGVVGDKVDSDQGEDANGDSDDGAVNDTDDGPVNDTDDG